MAGILVLSCLLVIGFGACSGGLPRYTGRIVGGEDTDITQVPYQVAIERYGGHFCGGSLVTVRHVITAAQCVIRPDSLRVRIGSTFRNQGGDVHEIENIEIHPKYKGEPLDYDVAVIELKENITLTDRAKPIKLISQEPGEGTVVLTSGWGFLNENGYFSDRLQSVNVSIFNRDECKEIYAGYHSPVTPRMFCARDIGKDACNADNGGPAVVNNQLLGIISWSVGCASPRYPGVYTNLTDHEIRHFITTHTNL